MRYVLIAAAVLVVIVAVIFVIGAMLPVKHRAQRTARFSKPPADLYRVLVGPSDWVPGKKIAYEQVEAEPPRKLVTRIADKTLPFGGTWTYELTPAGEGTDLTITEGWRGVITRCSGLSRNTLWDTPPRSISIWQRCGRNWSSKLE